MGINFIDMIFILKLPIPCRIDLGYLFFNSDEIKTGPKNDASNSLLNFIGWQVL